MTAKPYVTDEWIRLTERMLNSFARWTGQQLIPRVGPVEDSEALYNANFVVVAHGTEEDPLLNYGNLASLKLWSMELDQLIGTPSRKTAEPVHRSERSELLRRTREHGYIDDYSGIRIASDGARFRIQNAVVWNVINESGQHAGQAATFCDWTTLSE